VGRPGSGTEG
jgi:hypothetical protein